MSEQEFAREERAFRAALEDAAEELEPLPLSAPRPPRRRRWPMLAAAAAAAAVIGVAAQLGPGAGPTTDATDGSPEPTTVAADDLPSGWRWESFRDVVVGVPDDWGYDWAPGSDWCADTGREGSTESGPQGPFVDIDAGMGGQLDIACPDAGGGVVPDVPARLYRTHLRFVPIDPTSDLVAADVEKGGWHLLTRPVTDAVAVEVLADAGHLEVAREILGTARQVTADHRRCLARSPIQAGDFPSPDSPGLTGLAAVESVTVCQYALGEPDRPWLLASRTIDGPVAADLVAAIREAPEGGGPNREQNCLPEDPGSFGLVLQVRADGTTRQVYGYVSSCHGNGFDDGTTLRAVTRDNCSPIFGDRVVYWDGDSAVARLCTPPTD